MTRQPLHYAKTFLARSIFRYSVIMLVAFAALFAMQETAAAQDQFEPQWYPYTIARPADRIAIQSLPVEARPYRPLHFYGNVIRREHHRGTPLPQPRDIVLTARSIFVIRR